MDVSRLVLRALPALVASSLSAQSLVDSAARLVARADSAATTGADGVRWAVERWLEGAELYLRAADTANASRSLQLAGRAQVQHSQFTAALLTVRRARLLEQARGDRGGEARQLLNLGTILSLLGQGDSARRAVEEATRLGESAKDDRLVAGTLLILAQVSIGHVSNDSVLTLLRRSLSLAQSSGESRAESVALSTLALVFENAGMLDSALAYGHRSLHQKRATGDQAGEAVVMQNLGNTFRRLGMRDSSIAYLRLSLQARRQIGDRYGQARTLGSLGAVFNDAGAKDSAKVYLQAALTRLRELGDRNGVGTSLNLLGIVHEETGAPDSAIIYYRAALVEQRAVGDRREIGATLNNLAIAFTALSRLDSARVAAESALVIRREIGDRQGEGYTLELLGTLAVRSNQPDSALLLFRRARDIARETNHRLAETARLDQLSNVLSLMGRADSAMTYGRQALQIAREVADPEGEARALFRLARLHRAAGHKDVARATFDSAATIRSGLRRQAGQDFTRTSIAELHANLYEEWAIAWGDEPGNAVAERASLAAAERGRAQALLDLMTAERPPAGRGDLGEEGVLLAAIMRRGARTGTLYYLTTADTLLIWFASSRRELALYRVPVSRDSLASVIRRFRESLGETDPAAAVAQRTAERDGTRGLRARAPGSMRAVQTAGQAVVALLLPASMRASLAGITELVIVAPGPLALIPFAALPVGPGLASLGEQYAIRYAPSLRTLSEAEARPTSLDAGRRSGASFARAMVVGNPSMPTIGATAGLGALPGAETEGRQVAALLGVDALLGARATEQAVRSRLEQAPVVHLATHGLAYQEAARARESFVALTADSAYDGVLTVGELLDEPGLRMSAELVVLSSCQSGLGDVKQAEGTVGLQRAFLARGARSVLVSLWNVSDDATQLLMSRFYRHWLRDADRPSKAESLRRAVNFVRRRAEFAHPRYWAAFQVVGAS